MSNYVNIIPTKFENLADPSDVEYGFRWWDDDNSNFDHAPGWSVPTDRLEFLAFVLEEHRKDEFTDLIEWCYKNKRSLTIARAFVEWEEWSPVYVKHLESEGWDPPELENDEIPSLPDTVGGSIGSYDNRSGQP